MRKLLGDDPGGRALRRAARIAVTLPPTLFAALHLPYISQGALLAAFSCLAQTLFADFGGPLKRRFWAYMITTAAGVPLILAGTFASPSRTASVITAVAVALIVGMLAVLRGVVAAAQTVLLLATVLALTAVEPATRWPSVLAWVLGGVVAGVAAVTLWPLQATLPIRAGVADVLAAIADACDARWIDHDPSALKSARQRSTDALTSLHAKYDGNLLRPSGATEADRALAELVDEVGRLRYLQRWEDVSESHDQQFSAIMAQECRDVTSALRACAARLRGGHDPLSAQALFDLRVRNLDEMSAWLSAHRGSVDSTHLREQLDDAFPLRITTVVTSRITDLTIITAPAPHDQKADFPEDASGAKVKVASQWTRLRAQLSWESPWFRNAARTAVALGLSVAVAKSVSLDHPFWIVLGTLSALRFDALGTGRQAWQALVGTTVGVAFSAVVLAIVGTHQGVWWLLLPVALFVAGYTPGTTSFAVGQAAFTFTVIVLFSIIAPSGTELAEVRWIDVVLGLGISLLVSLLMWPRGVVETLYSRLRDAMTNACDFYVATTDWLAGGAIDARLLQGFSQRSWQSLDRAREALDLSIAQQPPRAIALEGWTAMANTIRHIDFAARLAPNAKASVATRGADPMIPMPLVGPLLACSNDTRDRLNLATDAWSLDSAPRPFQAQLPQFSTADSVVALRTAIDDYLQQPAQWTGAGPDPRPAIVVWLADWAALFDRSAQVLSRSA